MQTIKLKTHENVPCNYTGIIKRDDGSKSWWLNSKLHRVDGPAIEWADGTKSWYLNGQFHREDGPAVEYVDGTKSWWLNGKLHRTDGPACEWPDGDKHWYLNGEYHRVDGPAVEDADGTKIWYLNGEFIFELSPEDQPFLILEEIKKEVKILTTTETKWAPIVPGLKELENKPCNHQ